MTREGAQKLGGPLPRRRTPRRGRAAIAAVVGLGVVTAGLSFTNTQTLVHASAATKAIKGHQDGHAPDETAIMRTGPAPRRARVKPAFVSTSGSAWGWQNPSIQGNALNGISCAALGYCTTVGDAGATLVTTNSGVTWYAQTPASSSALFGVACTTTTTCIAVGSGGTIATSSGGTWTSRASGVAVRLSAVACPSSSTCYAVGDTGVVLKTTTSGTSWSLATVPAGLAAVSLDGVSCASTTWCVAVGSIGTVLVTTGGSTWATGVSNTSEALRSVSCPTTTFCAATGNHGSTLTYNGTAWANQAAVTVKNLVAVSCVSATSCAALGDSGTAYTWTGSAPWTAQASGTASDLRAASCVGTAPEQCWGAGAAGVIIYTALGSGSALLYARGANTWTPQDRTATTSDLAAVSCPSTATCVAVGGGGAVVATAVSGTYWGPMTSGTSNPLTGISCPSTTVCWAVGENLATGTPYVLKLTSAGNVWSSPGATTVGWSGTPFGYFNAVSCASTSACVAVGDGGLVAVYNGTSWTGTAPSPATAGLNGVACMSSTSCAAVGDSGTIRTYNGSSWTTATSGTFNFLTSVSCRGTAGPCVVAGALGTIVWASTPTTTPWTPATTVGTKLDLLAVVCPSSGTCTAVGQGGTVVTAPLLSGGVWTSQASGTANTLEGMTCTTTNCVAVGNPGTIVMSAPPAQSEDVFAGDSILAGWYATFNGSSLGAWSRTNGTFRAAPTAIWNPMTGQYDVYAIAGSGGTQQVYYASEVPGTDWPGAWPLLANGSSHTQSLTVGADLRPDGYDDVFVEGSGTDLSGYHAIVSSGYQISGFASMDSAYLKATGAPTAIWNGAQLDSYAVYGTGDVVWDTNASGWTYLDNQTIHSGAPSVTINLRPDGTPTHEDLFVDGADNASWTMITTGGGGVVTPPGSMGGGILGPARGDWTSTLRASALGNDHKLWCDIWNGSWSWSGPFAGPGGGTIGGTTVSVTNR